MDTALAARLNLPHYPRSTTYDPVWVLENLMGPNVLWLAETLTDILPLTSGMRVLDLGCGKAISSIFLAQEFGVEVWATDLWIAASDNLTRIRAAGVEEHVYPVHAEAHALPYAHGFFDAIISLDAYHYFGTDDLYLSYISRFLKPSGVLGIVVPGLHHELEEGLPEHLRPNWDPDFWSFHSPGWWRRHWERSGLVDVNSAGLVPDGWKHWLIWLEVCAEAGYRFSEGEMSLVRDDAGRILGFSRMVATIRNR